MPELDARGKCDAFSKWLGVLQSADEAGRTVFGLKVDYMFLSIKDVGKLAAVFSVKESH